MLYDPKWNYVASPLEANLDDLISWLEAQPSDQKMILLLLSAQVVVLLSLIQRHSMLVVTNGIKS